MPCHAELVVFCHAELVVFCHAELVSASVFIPFAGSINDPEINSG